ncbi:toxin-activating lysine-acyltransferase [Klebsiella aerogenes]|uniref:toxin-activating lysine-acyltransferase n=1 Tax=Klebsiella aerogenes TaxID=548 RepID=UPI000DA1C1B7|nr:toxin-activating lysine-acyltransferase [Klebsiella aerogenes]HCB2860318.1 toxin-activating lysine-acyltransferase [Klebsiella aerogenes]HCB2865492.1 toxin-activating lysine-acyltransferase [Klebsiella aerogenes]HCB2881447.1 toxin-activating lysine-acyltransferase [Klebsiella aerogenes]HCB3346316.1 toxin-activating lysine-acyltransferase [Klebsiella aerogenes]HCM1812386.1 toxin-activating lysine-acyltransferase [Klebsiella aerogenes]
MEWNGYTVQCPLVLGGRVNEVEVLGASVWLWMHSARHKGAPLETLPTSLLPVIKARQYVLAFKGDKPVLFMSWAWFDEDAEQRYLTEHRLQLKEADWCCGNRMWAIDWIAPFGDTQQMAQLVQNELFPDHYCRSRWRHARTRGEQVKNFRGKNISNLEKRAWQEMHPLPVSVKER